MTEIKEEWAWVGYRLPCRHVRGTYDIFKYDEMPALTESDILPQFKDVKTWDDLADNLELIDSLITSPTACYFKLSKNKTSFYRDQQDCVVWALDHKTGAVYTMEEDGVDLWVAKSLPEFLTRLYLEGQIWLKTFGYRSDETFTDSESTYANFYMKE